MAFVQSPIPEEEQNQLGPAGQTTPNPLGMLPPQAAQTGGSAGQGGGSQAGGAAPTKGTPTQFGSNASKLGDYLKANQDQVQNMAGNIAGNLGQQFGNVKGSIDQAGQQFGGMVSGGYTPYDPTVINQAAANPTGFAAKPENVKAFQSQFNDQYTGPSSFEGSTPYANVQKGLTDAVQEAGQLNTYPGLSTYLQNNVEKNATPGQNTLDTVLLQGNQPAYAQVQNAAKSFSTLPDYLANLGTTQNQAVQKAQSDAAKAAGEAKTKIGGTATNFQKSLQDQLSKTNASRDVYNTNVQSNQQSAQAAQKALNDAKQAATSKYFGNVANLAGNPTSAATEQARIAGLIDPSSYLSQLDPFTKGNVITQPGTLGNVSTTDQYAEDAALKSLMGDFYNPNLNQANIGQAGSYSIPSLSGTVPDVSGESQYMGDIASLYGIAGLANANAPGGWNNANPIPVAQAALNAQPGQGVTYDAATREALQRLVGNSYAGR